MLFVKIALGLVIAILIFGVIMDKVPTKGGLIAALVVALLFVGACSLEVVKTGYTGVRVKWGIVDPEPATTGWNLKMPFVEKIVKVNNKQQDAHYDAQVWSETSQRTAIYYEKVTVSYRISVAKSAWIYANVEDYENNLITEGIVQSSIKASSKQLDDIDATNRSLIEPLCKEYLQKALNDKYGEDVVIITKVIIGNADFDKAYNDAILAKQQAKIEAEKQEVENKRRIEKAEADAKVMETEANAEAKKQLIESEAKAKAEVIEAEAKAEANRLLQQSLAEEVITKLWIDKWDGRLPYYITGDNAGNMIGIGIPASPTPTPAATE